MSTQMWELAMSGPPRPQIIALSLKPMSAREVPWWNRIIEQAKDERRRQEKYRLQDVNVNQEHWPSKPKVSSGTKTFRNIRKVTQTMTNSYSWWWVYIDDYWWLLKVVEERALGSFLKVNRNWTQLKKPTRWTRSYYYMIENLRLSYLGEEK